MICSDLIILSHLKKSDVLLRITCRRAGLVAFFLFWTDAAPTVSGWKQFYFISLSGAIATNTICWLTLSPGCPLFSKGAVGWKKCLLLETEVIVYLSCTCVQKMLQLHLQKIFGFLPQTVASKSFQIYQSWWHDWSIGIDQLSRIDTDIHQL